MMAENKAHKGESKEARLKRFQNGSSIEVIETLLNSIGNYFNNEIALTVKENNYQTSLLFLGIHAVALTIGEAFFNQKNGLENYKKFLETFVDGTTNDTRFSTIAKSIHSWRNILAHQWLGSLGHEIGYDYEMKHGWEKRDDVLFINPKIYCEHYLNAFGRNGKLWDYQNMFSETELEAIKKRLIDKYVKR